MITAVVAIGLSNEMGKDNQLIWHLPKDLKHFKEITMGKPVVMGRKTYESIGKPLPNRTNIVVTRKKDWFQEGILIVGSIKEALKFAKKINEDICIIGGEDIFKQTLGVTDRLEVTVVKANFEADTFFPEIDEKVWLMSNEVCHPKDEKNEFEMCFQTFERKFPLK